LDGKVQVLRLGVYHDKNKGSRAKNEDSWQRVQYVHQENKNKKRKKLLSRELQQVDVMHIPHDQRSYSIERCTTILFIEAREEQPPSSLLIFFPLSSFFLWPIH